MEKHDYLFSVLYWTENDKKQTDNNVNKSLFSRKT